jgi:hypothetical protein
MKLTGEGIVLAKLPLQPTRKNSPMRFRRRNLRRAITQPILPLLAEWPTGKEGNMGLASTLAQIVNAAMRAIASFTVRFCKETGRWIVERVAQPAWEYFGEATTAAAKLPGATLRGTAAMLEGGGTLAGATLGAAAAVPGAVGPLPRRGRRHGSSPAPPAQPQGGGDDIRDLMAALDARQVARV